MKRLGVKILKHKLQTRDPKKQQQISKTMIQQMVQRKQRVKAKYMKQVQELNNNINLTMSINKIKDERNKISENIRVLVDQFADLDEHIQNMVKLSKSRKQSLSNDIDITRNLPRSMIQNNDRNKQNEMMNIDQVFESNEELRNIIFDDNNTNSNNTENNLCLPAISNPVQLMTLSSVDSHYNIY